MERDEIMGKNAELRACIASATKDILQLLDENKQLKRQLNSAILYEPSIEPTKASF